MSDYQRADDDTPMFSVTCNVTATASLHHAPAYRGDNFQVNDHEQHRYPEGYKCGMDAMSATTHMREDIELNDHLSFSSLLHCSGMPDTVVGCGQLQDGFTRIPQKNMKCNGTFQNPSYPQMPRGFNPENENFSEALGPGFCGLDNEFYSYIDGLGSYGNRYVHNQDDSRSDTACWSTEGSIQDIDSLPVSNESLVQMTASKGESFCRQEPTVRTWDNIRANEWKTNNTEPSPVTSYNHSYKRHDHTFNSPQIQNFLETTEDLRPLLNCDSRNGHAWNHGSDVFASDIFTSQNNCMYSQLNEDISQNSVANEDSRESSNVSSTEFDKSSGKELRGESCSAVKTKNEKWSAKNETFAEPTGIVDVDHLISSGVTVAGYRPRNIIRKRQKKPVPKTGKDTWYFEKRKKNNESARRSRELKKEKEKDFYRRALELEYENMFLKERIGYLQAELSGSSHASTNGAACSTQVRTNIPLSAGHS